MNTLHLVAPPITTDSRILWGRWMNDLRAEAYDFVRSRPLIRLTAPLIWRDADGHTVTVPVGFISDGASIPQAVWSLVGSPLGGQYVRASVVHDYDLFLHRYGYAGAEKSSSTVHKRFYNGMRAAGTSWLKANTFYRFVQVGGARW